MSKSIRSVVEVGAYGLIVEIERHISNNLPAIVIVGSANKAVDEAKEVYKQLLQPVASSCHANV